MTYSIKEVSKIFNLSIYTLRYYDKQGLLPFVSKKSIWLPRIYGIRLKFNSYDLLLEKYGNAVETNPHIY